MSALADFLLRKTIKSVAESRDYWGKLEHLIIYFTDGTMAEFSGDANFNNRDDYLKVVTSDKDEIK